VGGVVRVVETADLNYSSTYTKRAWPVSVRRKKRKSGPAPDFGRIDDRIRRPRYWDRFIDGAPSSNCYAQLRPHPYIEA